VITCPPRITRSSTRRA